MIRSITHHIPSSLLILLCLTAAGLPACAQGTPAATAPPAATAAGSQPADVSKSLGELADLDVLVALTPLGMNTAQIDTLTTLLVSIDKGGADLDAKNDETIRGVAEDIDKAHSTGLKGTPPDMDARGRISKAMDEIDKRLRDARTASIKRVVVTAEQNLTPEQIKVIETQYSAWMGGKIALPSKYRNDEDGRKAYIEEQALTEYADRILLSHRTVDLLHKLREVAPDPPAPAAAIPPAAPAAPPAGNPPPAAP